MFQTICCQRVSTRGMWALHFTLISLEEPLSPSKISGTSGDTTDMSNQIQQVLKTARQCLSGLVGQIPCSVHCSPELPDAPWQQMTNFLCAVAGDHKNVSCTHTQADFMVFIHLIFSILNPVYDKLHHVVYDVCASQLSASAHILWWMYITRLTFSSSC